MNAYAIAIAISLVVVGGAAGAVITRATSTACVICPQPVDHSEADRHFLDVPQVKTDGYQRFP